MTLKIRYRFIDSQIVELFKIVEYIDSNLLSFPLDMVSIIKLFDNYKIWSYQYYSKRLNVAIEQVVENCQSHSGCTFYNRENNRYVIVFNKEIPIGRQRWTLAHELGHCFLNHFDNISGEMISENNITLIFDKTLEMESDYFASMLLAPFPLYKQLGIKSAVDIKNTFGLSGEASTNRFNDYSIWKENHYNNCFDNEIIKLFSCS